MKQKIQSERRNCDLKEKIFKQTKRQTHTFRVISSSVMNVGGRRRGDYANPTFRIRIDLNVVRCKM